MNQNPLPKKMVRNAHSTNPKKNPSMRHKTVNELPTVTIGTFALKPKRDALGRPIKGRFVRFWGGRKPSKYIPRVEDAKHAAKATP